MSRLGNVGLAHTRLAIIDLSPTGHQPMTYEDSGVTIIFNGEIYNYRELRAELLALGFRFRGQSDTEVLVVGYLAWGERLLERVNGIFAFAIYDERSQQLFVVRDQMGVKPLYYAQTAEGFAFASEIKALLELTPIETTLDVEAMGRYVAFLYSPGDATPLAAVRKLRPGHALIVRHGEIVRHWTYWSLPRYNPKRNWTATECSAELSDLLARCVRRQMVSDAPIGALASGGLDSSAVIAAALQRDKSIPCFTASLEGGAEAGSTGDLSYAGMLARRLGLDLHEVHLTPNALCDNIECMVDLLEEPLADPASLIVYFISKRARELGAKVLLSGAGGDDLFTGYRRHQALALGAFLDFVPSYLLGATARLLGSIHQSSGWGRRLARLARMGSTRPRDRILETFLWTSQAQVQQLMAGDVRDVVGGDVIVRPLKEVLTRHRDEPVVQQCLALEQSFFLADHNLTYTDKMGMAAGVEIRVPLIDVELVDFASTIPVEWKLHGLKTKWILKRSQRHLVPHSIITRSKTGFGAPLRRWLLSDMKGLVTDLLSPKSMHGRGLFDPKAVTALIENTAAGRVDGTYTLFALMCIELWCRQFVDGRASKGSVASTPALQSAESHH